MAIVKAEGGKKGGGGTLTVSDERKRERWTVPSWYVCARYPQARRPNVRKNRVGKTTGGQTAQNILSFGGDKWG